MTAVSVSELQEVLCSPSLPELVESGTEVLQTPAKLWLRRCKLLITLILSHDRYHLADSRSVFHIENETV